MSSQSPAQVLLARTPASVSAAQTTAHTSARPRHAASSSISIPPQLPHGPLVINATFQSNARNPGTVKVTVEDSIFYVHRDVMSFASSFWEAVLDPAGGWLETSSEAATSYVGGKSELPERRWSRQIPLSRQRSRASQQGTSSDIIDSETLDEGAYPSSAPQIDSLASASGGANEDVETATVATSLADELRELKIEVSGPGPGVQETVGTKSYYEDNTKKIEARVNLKEEKAPAFQDLLHFVYPHLECVIHWNNVADLLTMAQKFDMPLLRRQCIAFLLTSVAGKPTIAMKVAEDHFLQDLYREASRFLLDSWSVWEQSELSILSSNTLLKLEKRRTWFLERLLKLGLINTQRDYVCCQSCPDPQGCGRMLDEKWRSAWSSAFRFGSPTPSNIWRSLRMLEPSLSSPALHLPHTSCQNHAKAWVADLFDRMFSLGVSTQRSFTVSSAASRGPLPDPALNKRYFLYVDWKS